MDELPYVLQKEIWEYVRGDRAHWRREFDLIVFELGQFTPNWHLRQAKGLQTGNHWRCLGGGHEIEIAHVSLDDKWHVTFRPSGWSEQTYHCSLAEAIRQFQNFMTEFRRIQFCGRVKHNL
jgi:hypothetical protein